MRPRTFPAARFLWEGLAALVALSVLASCARRPEAPAPKPQRTLTVAIEEPLTSLDPATDSLNAWTVLGNVFEPLVTHGAGLGIEPALAVRWSSPEDTVWSFELREGVSFHDGTPLAPEHVVSGLERVRGDTGSPVRSWLASIASIEAEPPSRVVVRTRWPDPLLLHHLAQVPIALGRNAKEITEHPVGTGPYRVVSFAGGGLEVEAFPRWWGGPAAIPRARFVAIPGGEASIEALSRGRVDIAFVLLSAGRPHALPFPTQEARGLSTMFLWINALGRKGENPLADVRVRRAVALGLDRQRLAERVTGREGDAAPQLVPATIFGSRPDAPFPPVDPAAARKLLAQAGHAHGLTLDLAFRDLPLLRRTAEEVARQLEAAGVRTTLRAVDYEGSLTPYREGARALFLDFWTFDVPDASSFLSDCVRTRDPLTGRGLLNPGFSSPKLDALVDRASALIDAPTRLDLIQQAVRLTEDEVPVVPLFEVARVWGHARDVSYQPRPDGRIDLTAISFRP